MEWNKKNSDLRDSIVTLPCIWKWEDLWNRTKMNGGYDHIHVTFVSRTQTQKPNAQTDWMHALLDLLLPSLSPPSCLAFSPVERESPSACWHMLLRDAQDCRYFGFKTTADVTTFSLIVSGNPKLRASCLWTVLTAGNRVGERTADDRGS